MLSLYPPAPPPPVPPGPPDAFEPDPPPPAITTCETSLFDEQHAILDTQKVPGPVNV